MAHAFVPQLIMSLRSSYLVLSLLIIGIANRGIAQVPLDTTLSRLEAWEAANRLERIHIHTDKPYYLAGDTIWFKVYTVIGSDRSLSGWSGAVYVDLISETDSLVAALKLPLVAGLAKGNIDLPNDLNRGNYRLRAYTQWMRNAGGTYFFDRILPIGKVSVTTFHAAVDYKYLREKSEVSAAIRYTDDHGRPQVGKPVRYVVKSSQEQIRVGNEKTDENGSISLRFNARPEYDSLTMYMVSTLTDGKNKQVHTFPVKSAFADFDVQFFPEGGVKVAGLRSRVAFKAVGTDGLGVDVDGQVLDGQGQVVTQFESVHAGMGVFSMIQEAGQTYTARVNLPDGTHKVFNIPHAHPSGYVLSAYTQAGLGEILVRLQTTKDRYGPVSLVLHRQGRVYYADDLVVSNPMTVIRLPTKDISSGITQLTLFDATGKPRNERVVFIENADTLRFTGIDWPQQVKGREPMTLKWKSTDSLGKPAVASFSVAVSNESEVPVDAVTEHTLFSELLLRSELKGYVERPNYYFTDVTDEKRDHLDLLMLTQGFRRFRWEDLLSSNRGGGDLVYPVEKIVTSIRGKLRFLRNNKPVPNGKVTLFSINANVTFDTVTNANGEFSFDNLMLSDSIKFTVQGRTENGGDKVEVIVDALPSVPITAAKNRGDIVLDVSKKLAVYADQTMLTDSLLQTLGLESRIIELDEVTVTASARMGAGISSNLNGPGNADQVISGNELSACATLRACLEGRLAGVRFQTTQTAIGQVAIPQSTRGGTMLVVIDGWTLNPANESDLWDIAGIFEQGMIDATQIVSVEVLRTPSLTTVYGQGGQNGVIIITTRGWRRGAAPNYSAKLYAPKGFSNAREFYVPKYGVSRMMDIIADQRTTVYWNPDIRSNESGNAEIQYINTTKPGWYRVVIEGITADGQLGRYVHRYLVENDR